MSLTFSIINKISYANVKEKLSLNAKSKLSKYVKIFSIIYHYNFPKNTQLLEKSVFKPCRINLNSTLKPEYMRMSRKEYKKIASCIKLTYDSYGHGNNNINMSSYSCQHI